MEEIWKVVEGYDGVYPVSNLGNVKTKTRTAVRRDGVVVTYVGKVLKQSDCPGRRFGYKMVHLYGSHGRDTWQVHRLVAIAFIQNPENKPCVNHVDGNKSNNCVSNLEWNTYAENNAHALSTGLKEQTPSSYKSKLTKLDYEARRDIIENYVPRKHGFTFVAFAKKYGVDEQTARKAYYQGLDYG